MLRSCKAPSALVALVLVACAHGGSTTSHIPAGRAAQPFGWPERLVATGGAAPATAMAAPGGRAAQPFGWPESLVDASGGPISAAPATAYVGGRAAQPFGWPEQPMARKAPATTTCAREPSHAQ
jgi:hypothetical protein